MSPETPDRCPRCGAGFSCGISGTGPCACTTVRLDEAALARLGDRYRGCLCLACLRELAAAEPAQGPVIAPAT